MDKKTLKVRKKIKLEDFKVKSRKSERYFTRNKEITIWEDDINSDAKEGEFITEYTKYINERV